MTVLIQSVDHPDCSCISKTTSVVEDEHQLALSQVVIYLKPLASTSPSFEDLLSGHGLGSGR